MQFFISLFLLYHTLANPVLGGLPELRLGLASLAIGEGARAEGFGNFQFTSFH